MKNNFKKFFKNNKFMFFVYFAFIALILFSFFYELINKHYSNWLTCVVSLILLFIPYWLYKKFSIKLTNTLQFIFLSFIFCTMILGQIYFFYGFVPYFDTVLHTINGFICSSIVFAFIEYLNKNKKIKFNVSSISSIIISIFVTISIGVFWEYFEFGMDVVFKTDMQKDSIIHSISSDKLNIDNKNKETIRFNNINKTIVYSDNDSSTYTIDNGYLDIGLFDTMKDLIVNFIGALIFSILGFIYIKVGDKSILSKFFIPSVDKC